MLWCNEEKQREVWRESMKFRNVLGRSSHHLEQVGDDNSD